MLNKTDVFSIFNRGLALLSGFLLVVLNLHFVHVEGQGEIALVNFGILLISTLSQFVGGGALIFLSKTYPINQFHVPAILWVFVSAALIFLTGQLLSLPAISFIAVLGIFQSLIIYFQMILLAKAKIMSYQFVLLTQSVITPIAIFLFYTRYEASLVGFCFGLLVSFALTFGVGLILNLKNFKSTKVASEQSTKSLFSDFIHFGGYNQLANLSQVGNQRIYIYMLESILNQGYLFSGIFALYLYLAEAIWTVGKSLSSILTSLVAQSNNNQIQFSHFKKYLKLSIIGTVVLSATALLLPKSILEPYLKINAQEIQLYLILMTPAILAHSLTIPIAHYFSGMGFLKWNFHCALSGLLIGFLTALYFIPAYELKGAFISFSLGFCTQCSLHLYYLLLNRPSLNQINSEHPKP